MKLRLRYADVASTLALVIALGGASYAAVLVTTDDIQDDTILSRDVHNNALTTDDVLDNSLRSRDVFDGTLNTADVQDGSLRSADLLDGTVGLADISDAAEAALKGQKGDPGVSGYVDVVGPWKDGVVGDTLTARAVCPAGKKPVGGGFESATGSMAFSPHYTHHITYPLGHVDFPDGAEVWEVQGHAVYNGVPGAEWHLQAWAVCAAVS